jgi:hypothetical protein
MYIFIRRFLRLFSVLAFVTESCYWASLPSRASSLTFQHHFAYSCCIRGLELLWTNRLAWHKSACI